MSIAPFRDTSIILTLESDLPGAGTGKVSTTTNAAFTNRFLPNSGVTGFIAKKLGKEPRSIVFTGVTSIKVGHAADVAEEAGLYTSFIQPWFIKSVPIAIDGESYLGAYSVLSVGDRDYQSTLARFRESLNDFNHPGKNLKRRFLLELKGHPRGVRRFLGYIKKLDFTHDIKNAYFLNYSIDFIGRSVDGAYLSDGNAGSTSDKNIAKNQTSGTIASGGTSGK